MRLVFRRWSSAALLTCGGVAVAQPWPPVSPTADAEPQYIMRTAGQSERSVKVVRPAADADGMAEVMDTATKQTFMIPGKVLAKLPKTTAAKPAASHPSEPHTKPVPAPAHPSVVVSPPPSTTPAPTPPVVSPKSVEATAPLPDKPAPEPITPPPMPAAAPPSAVVQTGGTTDPLPWWKDGDRLRPVVPVVEVVRPLAPLATDRWRSVLVTPAAPDTPPRLVPVASWKPALPTTPPTPGDPWRSGGG